MTESQLTLSQNHSCDPNLHLGQAYVKVSLSGSCLPEAADAIIQDFHPERPWSVCGSHVTDIELIPAGW